MDPLPAGWEEVGSRMIATIYGILVDKKLYALAAWNQVSKERKVIAPGRSLL